MKQTSPYPTNKMMFGALAGALTAILVWCVHTFFKVDIPPEIASAITVVLTFFTSWLTPPGEGDHIEQDGSSGP